MEHVKVRVINIKKIVYVTESMASGVLTYIKELANNLSDYANIYVLYGIRKQTPYNLQKLFNNNINLIKINDFQRSLNIKNDFKAYLELKYYIRKINPDIVHLNSSKAGALGRILKLFHFRNIKFFYTPHGYPFLMQDSSKCKRNIYYLIELLLSKLGTMTIACGKGEYEEARKLSRNSTYVNNGINIDYLSQFWDDNSNTENTIFTIGRINEQKNPNLFNQIAQKFPKKKFVWVGDGPLKNQLTSSNIYVTGWLSSKAVLQKIQSYRIFILCSKWEGLPISLLEAMYYKKLCLVTNVIGNNNVIINNQNGYLFNNINKAIPNMNANNYKELRANANNTIKNNHSLQKMFNKYRNIYRLELCKSKRRRF